MNIEQIPMNKILLDESNPNKMTEKQMEALVKSIKDFGELQPILIDKQYMVVDGEHRFRAYQKLGKETVPCIIIDIKGTQKRLLRQIMNKVRGEHDPFLDAEEFKSIINDIGLEDLSNYLAQSEQDILNLLNKADELSKEDNTENVDSIGKLQITCPQCGHKFKKGEK